MKNPLHISRLGLRTLVIVVLLVGAKWVVHWFGFEFLSLNMLFTSAIGGAVFILGFLLAGVFSDYREAGKMPAELRSALESIWEEGSMFARINNQFDIEALRESLLTLVQKVFSGLARARRYEDLSPALYALDDLSTAILEMERLGLPAPHIARMKSERSAARKVLLRILHMQRTKFVPSIYFLAQSVVVMITVLLLFLQIESSAEFYILFAFINYLFFYIVQLIFVLETPFREGDKTRDDISLFLLRDFADKLKTQRAGSV